MIGVGSGQYQGLMGFRKTQESRWKRYLVGQEAQRKMRVGVCNIQNDKMASDWCSEMQLVRVLDTVRHKSAHDEPRSLSVVLW